MEQSNYTQPLNLAAMAAGVMAGIVVGVALVVVSPLIAGRSLAKWLRATR